MKTAPLMLKNTVNMAFWAVIICATLSELHQPMDAIFANGRSAVKTTTRRDITEADCVFSSHQFDSLVPQLVS
jgi:hypothetical protein